MAISNNFYLKTSFLKLFGQSKPIIIENLLGKGGHESIRMVFFHITKMAWAIGDSRSTISI